MPIAHPTAAPGLPKYLLVYRRIRGAIDDGQLKPGDRVPSLRALATELNLARGTVEAAYEMLISEGYLTARGQAGTIIALDLATTAARGNSTPTPSAQDPLLPLQLGMPALDAFPRKLWARLITQRARQTDTASLSFSDPRGYAPLRSAIATYLGLYRGLQCTPDQVFICAGYNAVLELVCESLDMTGQDCWFEDPGYLHARKMLLNRGVSLTPVPVDGDGLQVERAIQQNPLARLAVVTPAHQSPLGVALSPERRQTLLAWAQQHSSWILEDDYDSEFRYRGCPLPALKSQDRHDRVLYAGTFSKMLFPGLRLAYLVVPRGQVEHVEHVCRGLRNRCPELLQATVSDFLSQGHFTRHLKKMRQLYSVRRPLLVKALEEICGGILRVDPQAGGINLVVRVLIDVSDTRIAEQARAQGLAVEPLSRWQLSAGKEGGLLMGFTNVVSAEQATQMARRLLTVIDAVRSTQENPAQGCRQGADGRMSVSQK
ncbi:MocR-like pyridoxine biosynthesis transcription factor PdxR [Pseudomonas agarici]|uniref:MocR-like pyridoxine biosynthesis transcription factor PdxR n=1 Tax=Pseudomonas agarici TaxID=46677 RepID=UPI0002DEF353|nr:PLP-dependent aminotransferase family protein [Pseudomonas agarici]NWB92347.1 PLP-dependent aminotransferase family protein [Pseudomonas agarici]NWC11601.1 PLP-dependent aminotransferase family protein [Pseudomonas agarici]